MWEAAAIQAGGSFLSNWLGNRAAREEAQRNRQFQERMRNTQWQAAVEDMRQAGLNPALAYSQGPNAAPSGSVADQSGPDLSGVVSTALQTKRLREDIQSMRVARAKMLAEKAKTDEERRAAKAAADMAEARRDYLMPEWGLSMTIPGDPSGRTYSSGPWKLHQLIDAEVGSAQQKLRQATAQANLLEPSGELSEKLGILGPILIGLMQGGKSFLPYLFAPQKAR